MSDSRLDALTSIGRLQRSIDPMSFWLIEHICGQELSFSDVAVRTGMDRKYVSQRFKEALWHAARHYGFVAATQNQAKG